MEFPKQHHLSRIKFDTKDYSQTVTGAVKDQ